MTCSQPLDTGEVDLCCLLVGGERRKPDPRFDSHMMELENGPVVLDPVPKTNPSGFGGSM